jgi:hypothetical protein
MAPKPDNSPHGFTLENWGLPAAVAIVVAGSLVFWICVGFFWLAARQPPAPPPPQPIVIWMPPIEGSSTADQSAAIPFQPALVPRDH